MIKVSVLYANGDDAKFDVDYYKAMHMAIVQRTMGPSKIEVDEGNEGPDIAACHLYFDDEVAHATGMGNSDEALADIPNFTNVTPVVQISTVHPI